MKNLSYNYSKLKGRIIEKFGSQQKFAEAIGLSERTLSLKMTNKVFWKQAEISEATRLLGLEEAQISDYFFTQIVQHN